MSQHAAPAPKAPLERKVWLSTLGTLAASAVVAVIEALMSDPGATAMLPGWATFLLITLGPPVVQFLAGYAAPHTERNDAAARAAAARQRART